MFHLYQTQELIQLQTNTRAKQIFDAKGYVCLWMENNIIAKTLSSIALKECIIPFATTYLAERAFSHVVTIKTNLEIDWISIMTLDLR